MSDRAGGLIAALLLGLVVALLLLTLVELTERGAPWSESGYHARRAAAPASRPRTRL